MRQALAFATWTPDLATAQLARVVNALPAPDGWQPFPHPSHTTTIGLSGTPTMLAAIRSASGLDYTFAGTTNRLYRADTSSWTQFDGTYSSASPWQAVAWGDVAYFVNGRDVVQKLDLAGSVQPEDVEDAPNGLGFRYIAQVADVLMGAWAVEDGGATQWPYRTQWTGVGRPERWTPNTATQADFQDHTDIGELRGLTGGEFCLIHGADGLIRGDYAGPPLVFDFRTLETDIGLEYPGSLASSSGRCFWWSKAGFRASGGGPSEPIGYGAVDEFFRTRLRVDFAPSISSMIVPERRVYMLAYPGPTSFDGTLTELLAYDWGLARWGFGKFDCQILGRGKIADIFTDDPGTGDTLTDAVDGNTDDGSSNATFGAALVGGALCRLVPLTTTLVEMETGNLRLAPGLRARVTRAWPQLEPSPTSLRLKVTTRERVDSLEQQISPSLAQEPDVGSIACDDAGMIHRFYLAWQGRWTKARGLELEFNQQGTR